MAGGNFTRGFATRKFPRGQSPQGNMAALMAALPPLARSRIPPATQAMLVVKVGRDAAASWIVHFTLEQALLVGALAGDTVLCSGARHFTLRVPLSIQMYKWVLVNLMLGVTL